jgi:pilus assembly protein CpaF
MTDELTSLFSGDDKGSMRMFAILQDPSVVQICVNRHDRIFYWDGHGQKVVNDRLFASVTQYSAWLNQLLALTDAGWSDVNEARTSVIEASFRADVTDVHGSIHIATSEVTRGEPALTVRKQPRDIVSLDDMLRQGMMNEDMRLFLQQAVHGRLNMVISGGSGAGKTTLSRALSSYIDPANRVITVEEIDELHLQDRLPNIVGMTSYRLRDSEGRVIRETTLEDLVREALRQRGDRIWVGETRGKEAYALCKACNSGHDGSITTIHADNGPQAVRQLVTYVMESGLPEQPAREQVSRAFHLVVQVSKEKMGRRVIREITELEPVLEGNQQRSTTLWAYDPALETFRAVSRPTRRLTEALARYGVNFDDVQGRL